MPKNRKPVSSPPVVIPSQAVMKRIHFLLEGIAIMGSLKHEFPVVQDEIVNIMRQWEAEEKAKS